MASTCRFGQACIPALLGQMDNFTGYTGLWMFLGLVVVAVTVLVGVWLIVPLEL